MFLIVSFVSSIAVAVPVVMRRRAARRRLAAGSSTIADRTIVTVVGKVRPLGELIAPLSGAVCVLHESHATILPERGAGIGRVDEMIVERKLVPFELETTDGIVRIEGPDFELATFQPVPLIPRKLDREIDFLIAHGRDQSVARHSGFAEVHVEPGAKISVNGMAIVDTTATSEERGFRDAARTIRIVAHADHPLTIGRNL